MVRLSMQRYTKLSRLTLRHTKRREGNLAGA
jgi:hypothetical protein